MAAHQIRCVRHTGRTATPETITDYGNQFHPANPWIMAKPAAIKLTYQGESFYTNENGQVAQAQRQGARSYEYLKTVGDRELSNNLENLPRCPEGLQRRH